MPPEGAPKDEVTRHAMAKLVNGKINRKVRTLTWYVDMHPSLCNYEIQNNFSIGLYIGTNLHARMFLLAIYLLALSVFSSFPFVEFSAATVRICFSWVRRSRDHVWIHRTSVHMSQYIEM